ncbi:MAG: hypothetical protein WCT04_24350 [Planctomycetota bacterium]
MEASADTLGREVLAAFLSNDESIGALRSEIVTREEGAKILRRKLELTEHRIFKRLCLNQRNVVLGFLSLPEASRRLILNYCERLNKSALTVRYVGLSELVQAETILNEGELIHLPDDVQTLVRSFEFMPVDVRGLLEALLGPLALEGGS